MFNNEHTEINIEKQILWTYFYELFLADSLDRNTISGKFNVSEFSFL